MVTSEEIAHAAACNVTECRIQRSCKKRCTCVIFWAGNLNGNNWIFFVARSLANRCMRPILCTVVQLPHLLYSKFKGVVIGTYIRTSYISKPVSLSQAITSSSSHLMITPELLLDLLPVASSALGEEEPRVPLFFFFNWQRGAALEYGFEGVGEILVIRELGHLARLEELPPIRVYSHVSWWFSQSKCSITWRELCTLSLPCRNWEGSPVEQAVDFH